jgi:hypothetical protein
LFSYAKVIQTNVSRPREGMREIVKNGRLPQILLVLLFLEFIRGEPNPFIGHVVDLRQKNDLAVPAFDGDGCPLGFALVVGDGDLQARFSDFVRGGPVAGRGIDFTSHMVVARRNDDGRLIEFDDGFLIFGALDAAISAEMLSLRGREHDLGSTLAKAEIAHGEK